LEARRSAIPIESELHSLSERSETSGKTSQPVSLNSGVKHQGLQKILKETLNVFGYSSADPLSCFFIPNLSGNGEITGYHFLCAIKSPKFARETQQKPEEIVCWVHQGERTKQNKLNH
jgi:hypothetical protein